jgi:transposase
MITASFTRELQRETGRIRMRFLPRFQEVKPISKTRNQLAGMIPNIKENPRNRRRTKRGRKRLFNAAIHALRMRVERTFAWEDKFKRLLLRFERIQQRHYGMKLLAYTLINLRSFCGT